MEMEILDRATAAIGKGDLIVYPTDTLYGLGANVFNVTSIEKVYDVKQRPRHIPLSIMVSSLSMMEEIGTVNEKTKEIIKKFLPGPLTVVIPKKNVVPDIIAKDKIAVRIPNNQIALHLATLSGPITATSANIHGGRNPTTINIAKGQLGETVSVYIDSGRLPGKPSTILEINGKNLKVLREGAIGSHELLR
jgi:L-threonylcarbamoyladenylate synthase